VKGDYTAHNYGGSVYGVMDLRSATRRSVNTVYTRLIDDVGVEDTMKLANRMGVHTEPYDPARHGISVALGSLEVSPLNMAAAYGVFAARGQKAEPRPVVSVIVRETKEALENNAPDQIKREEVLKEVVADNVTAILRGVLEAGGTAAGKGIGRPAAGKTGTAQDNKDAWFVGYTPNLSTAVWMGFPDPGPDGKIPLLKGIKGVGAVTGGSFPAATWQAFMQAAHAGIEVTEFNEPAPIRTIVEEVQRRVRQGYSVGARRNPEGTDDGGSVVEDVAPPRAQAPPAPTTTTTTTTIPFDEGFDDDPDGGDDDGGGGTGPIVIPGA
jgi:membrane peptidoglycan carboxypeptidase